MRAPAPRLMYWPNELTEDPIRRQIGPRQAFERLAEIGALSDYVALSYQFERRQMADETEFSAWAIRQIQGANPDILFVQHPGHSGVTSRTWSAIRSAFPRLRIVYHEADVYDRFLKRVDREIKDLCKAADVILLCALGKNERLFQALSTAAIDYMPHCYDGVRFGNSDPRGVQKVCDAVMIGNRIKKFRMPFLSLPGGLKRARLASLLEAELGDRFHLYGGGWEGRSSGKGAVDFSGQERVIQSARISVNWDHYDDLPFYFSDRLPISLAAGIPHVTCWHPGYDELLGGCPGLYLVRSPLDALNCTRALLRRSDDELANEGLAARDWVSKRLQAKVVFADGLQTILKHLGISARTSPCPT